MIRWIFWLVALVLVSTAWAEPVRYVSDDLGLPMRSGKGLQHKILKLVPSGTRVEVLEVSEADGYTRIRIPEGGEGWVLSRYLMDGPGAKDQLARAQRRLERLGTEAEARKTELEETRQSLEENRARVAELETANAELSTEVEHLRAVAAEPIRLSEENAALGSRLEETQTRIDTLEQENRQLRNDSLKLWFALGAGVSIGSLILGLVITRIPWRRNRWDFH